MTEKAKYSLVLKTGHLLSIKGHVVLFDTFKEAEKELKSSDKYDKVTLVYTEVKEVVKRSIDINPGSLLDSRLEELSLVVVKGDSVPTFFKEKFDMVVKGTEFDSKLIATLKDVSRTMRKPILVCIEHEFRELPLQADLYMCKQDDFYKILKFRSTARYTNEYTLFNLNA